MFSIFSTFSIFSIFGILSVFSIFFSIVKYCEVGMLTTQLLELSKQLAAGKSFKLTLKTKDNDFRFSSQDKEVIPKEAGCATKSLYSCPSEDASFNP